MPLTRTKFIRLLRIGAVILATIMIGGYAAWRSFAYVQGPKIEVFTPVNGSTVSSPTVEVTGQALRINALTINGNPISVDESGNFKDTRAVFPGINILTLHATDQFGRSTETHIQIVGGPEGQ